MSGPAQGAPGNRRSYRDGGAGCSSFPPARTTGPAHGPEYAKHCLMRPRHSDRNVCQLFARQVIGASLGLQSIQLEASCRCVTHFKFAHVDTESLHRLLALARALQPSDHRIIAILSNWTRNVFIARTNWPAMRLRASQFDRSSRISVPNHELAGARFTVRHAPRSLCHP